MITPARIPTALALSSAVLLAACGNDLDSRNEAAMAGNLAAERGMTIRSQPDSTARRASAPVQDAVDSAEMDDSEKPILIDASPEDLMDNAQGFAPDPVDNAQGFDPSPRSESTREPEEQDG